MKLIRKWIAALCITGLILWPQQAFASVSLFPALLRDPLLTLVNKDHPLSENWLMAHCAEYGFILRYPVDKSEITGIGYEPWHYRYVGKRNAGNIMDSGLCLEEYLDLLEQNEKAPFGHFFDLGA